MIYFFILGRNPELSIAELNAVLPSGWKPVSYSKAVLIVECPQLDAESLMRRLGGTTKIGQIISPVSSSRGSIATAAILEIASRVLAMTDTQKKLFLGLSAYAIGPATKLPSVRALRQLGIEIKRVLQEKEYRVRLVTSKEIALSSVIVKKERLLRQGMEIVLLYGAPYTGGSSSVESEVEPPDILMGKTIAVQEFEEASERDFGRPERSMGVGMLPIQLTKIMLNLARLPIYGGLSSGSPEERPPTILDPFCGLGTVLMEASQMGYKNLIGTDLEQTMIDATKKNLEWIKGIPTRHNSPQPSLTLREGVTLITTPVEQLSKHLPARSVDAIVTEPYMGPTRGIRNYELGIMDELIKLYIAAFGEFAKILNPGGTLSVPGSPAERGGRVVFVFPAFKNVAQLTKTSARVLPEIKKLGFSPMQLLPTSYALRPTYSITYSRPDQKVLREIFVLTFIPSLHLAG